MYVHPVFKINSQSGNAACGVGGSGGADADRLGNLPRIKLVDRSLDGLENVFRTSRLGRGDREGLKRFSGCCKTTEFDRRPTNIDADDLHRFHESWLTQS